MFDIAKIFNQLCQMYVRPSIMLHSRYTLCILTFLLYHNLFTDIHHNIINFTHNY